MTSVLVIGATGRQGGAVTDLLLGHGHTVDWDRVLSRQWPGYALL